MGIITFFLQMGKWRQESLIYSRLHSCNRVLHTGLSHHEALARTTARGIINPDVCQSHSWSIIKVQRPGPLPRPMDSKHGMGPTASTDTSVTGNPDGRQLEAASLLGKHLHYTPALCSPTAGGTVALCCCARGAHHSSSPAAKCLTHTFLV